MSKPTGQEVAEAFGNFVNNYGCDPDAFIEGFCRQHRTLQQSIMRVMMQTIEHCASEDYHFDGRNQGTHDLAKKLLKGFKHVIGEQFASDRHNGELTEGDKNYLKSNHCVPSNALSCI